LKVIKLTTPWSHDYYRQTPGGKGVIGEYKFEINNNCRKCDYWIVWGGVLINEKVKVNTGEVIYITDEAHDRRKFDDKFLNQFFKIATVRNDLGKYDIIPIHEFAPWYMQKSYDFFETLVPPSKTKNLSIVSSNLTWLPGHKRRYDFVMALIDHFKDKIDAFGRGFNPIPDKFDALIDYKYSIAIENNSMPGYFTEKISECFLTYTMPVYYGCPDIGKYYDPKSLFTIDINRRESAFKSIEQLLEDDPYEKRLPFISNSRDTFLHKYHVLPAIIALIESLHDGLWEGRKPKWKSILPEQNSIDKETVVTNHQSIVKKVHPLKKWFRISN